MLGEILYKRYFILTTVFVLLTEIAIAQVEGRTRIVAQTPALNTKIYGIGVGAFLHDPKYDGDTTTTVVNGLNLELMGVGFIGPLVFSHPIVPKDMRHEQVFSIVDSLISVTKNNAFYKINGINLSLFGTAGENISINGLNVSGISSITSITNGMSLAFWMNMSAVMNGVSIGMFNRSLDQRGIQMGLFNISQKAKGLQIGLWHNMNSIMDGVSIGIFNLSLEHNGLQVGIINKSERTKGIQIGLWNENEKRSLPFINWNF